MDMIVKLRSTSILSIQVIMSQLKDSRSRHTKSTMTLMRKQSSTLWTSLKQISCCLSSTVIFLANIALAASFRKIEHFAQSAGKITIKNSLWSLKHSIQLHMATKPA